MNAVVQARNFSVSFRNTISTSVENFSAHAGQITQISGPNGVGKSVFLQSCAGITPHISGGEVRGSLTVCNVPLVEATPERLRSHVIYIPSAIDMFFLCPTLFDEIVFTCAGLTPDASIETLHYLAHDFAHSYELNDIMHIPFSQLSYGQRALCAVVCSCIASPELILMDEVMSSLDTDTREKVHSAFTTYIAGGGCCITADHDYTWKKAHQYVMTPHTTDQHSYEIDVRNWIRKSGELICLTGDNGSGKTTLLRHLAGFVPREFLSPEQRDRATEIGVGTLSSRAYMPQESHHMFYRQRVRDHFSSQENLIDDLGFTQLCDSHPFHLSYGQQKRVALGLVLATRRNVLLLDEPTRGLDSHSAHAITSYISQYCHHNAVSIVCATHDDRLISAADRVITCTPSHVEVRI